jgi:hypothetical protein
MSIKPENLPTAAYLEERFYSIMYRLGYAATPESSNIKPDPLVEGGKILTYNEFFIAEGSNFLLMFADRWWKGGGHSTFHLQDTFGNQLLLWTMTYEGVYNEGAIPALMEALQAAYKEKKFYGCRGPHLYKSADGNLQYSNHCTGTFSFFVGKEVIHKEVPDSHRLQGFHTYWGGMQTRTTLE